MAKHTVTFESVLSTLSPEAARVLATHFRSQIASELVSSLAPKAKRAPAVEKGEKAPAAGKRTINRQKTNDGTDRSGSQFIRDYDAGNPGCTVDEVCEKAKEAGLDIKPSLVYNVRQNLRKKVAGVAAAPEVNEAAEEVANTKVAKKATPEEVNARMAKARAVAAANRAARAAAALAAAADAAEDAEDTEDSEEN